MPVSPTLSSSGLVKLIVTSDGQVIPDLSFMSVEIITGYNRIPRCLISIMDGDASQEEFAVSDSDVFKPGKSIVLQAGYGAEAATIFEGIVVRHGLSIDSTNHTLLELECSSTALAMTVSRHYAHHHNETDGEAITALLNKYSLTADVDATVIRHRERLQYNASDWDFMVARAEQSGLLVLVEGTTVTVKAPDTSATPPLQVIYGTDIMEFKAELTELPGERLAHLKIPAGLDAAEQEAWTKATQLKAELSSLRGRVKFQGCALAKTGTTLLLAGVGKRFNGTVLVTGVRHEIRDGNWISEASFGMDLKCFTEHHSKTAPPASSTTSSVSGLQIGDAIVSKSQLKIEFDDEKKILSLATPGGNSIAISDEGKSILLKDQNGNTVELGSSGISLNSQQNINIQAKGSITLEATGKLDLKSTQDFSAHGLNLNLNADIALTAKGSATAELSASGQTTIKGAMVMIN
ncbi:hypothetical protein [Uliginosibacterium sediminicola]|uniref:Rhs element Vgr protein n=1 Tax=Uliginosibacterium sediminicola TaxID=2024550 RepID=A0ABU9Z2B2_9RHOO